MSLKNAHQRPFLAILAILSAGTALTTSGCMTRGKAKEAHVSFGIAPLFSVQKDEVGISLTESGILKAADSRTKVQVLNFAFESSGKDVEVKFRKDEK